MRSSLASTAKPDRKALTSDFPAMNVNLRLGLRYLPPLINAALIVLIGLTVARLFWAIWPVQPTSLPPAAIQQDHPRSSAPEIDVQRIAAAHLFGRRTDGSEDIAAMDAPETQLDLTLTGIVAAVRGSDSWALIQEGKADQQAYTVGDGVAENVAVHAIHWNRVILERGGRFETLTLEIDREEGVQRDEVPDDDPGLAERLAEVRSEVADEPLLFSKYVTVKAVKEDGQVRGFRIFPTYRSRDVFEEAGIRAGELVTMVNGVALDNNNVDFRRLVEELKQASQLTLNLGRRGDQRTVTWALE